MASATAQTEGRRTRWSGHQHSMINRRKEVEMQDTDDEKREKDKTKNKFLQRTLAYSKEATCLIFKNHASAPVR